MHLTDISSTADSYASALTAIDCTGMPVPRSFVHDSSGITELTATGTPKTDYLTGEAFDAGDYSNPSESPQDTDEAAEFAVWALFDDGSWEEITDYDVIYPNGGDEFTAGDTTVTVRASYLGKTEEWTFNVNITVCDLL